MRIDIVTLFPEIANTPLEHSIMGRARQKNQVKVLVHQLRDWAKGKHKKTDDTLYGGGQGMLLMPQPLFDAVKSLKQPNSLVILMTPQGKQLTQAGVQSLSKHEHLIILCGHYEGVDHRVIDALVDKEISIGDYILSNGALAAAVLSDAIIRLLPNVLGDARSSQEESFSHSMLEAPAYTKPAHFQGMQVPEILLSGNHARIAAWKSEQALKRTQEMRPDLLKDGD